LEIYAIDLETKASKLITLSLHIAPIGDCKQFIKNLDNILKHLYKPKTELLFCNVTDKCSVSCHHDYFFKDFPWNKIACEIS
jgi:hypothetical protein